MATQQQETMLAEAADGFFLAAEYGRSDVLKALADHAQGQLDLRQIVEPTTGRTPLHVAVANGKTDAVRVLLAAGFPPDHESFPAAATAGNSSNARGDAVDAALSGGDAPRKRQNTAYLLAKQLRATDLVFVFHQFTIQQIATNNVDGVRQMLSAGVDADTTDGSAQNTFVHWAVTCSASQVLELLLERNDIQRAKVMDRVNAEGATPLHLACRANNVECTRLLLKYHADRAIEGEKGAFNGRVAMQLATTQEVRDLFAAQSSGSLQQQERSQETGTPASSSSSSSSASASPPSSGSTVVESVGDDEIGSAGGVSLATRRNSRRVSEQDQQSARLLLQLEEKDLLIIQLRKTIEALVIESQEIRKLGDERVVLDYVRKLREENAIMQRNLDDAEEHIRIQQEQLQQLKSEIRKAVTVKQLPVSPLRLDTSGEHSKHNWTESKPPLSSSSNSSETWGKSVLGGLWPFGGSDEVQDIDGEVIMTV